MEPKTMIGTLTATKTALYKVPQERYALVAAGTFHNTHNATRNVDLLVGLPGGTALALLQDTLAAARASGDSVSIAPERWLLTEGATIEGLQDTGSDVNYLISVLEYEA